MTNKKVILLSAATYLTIEAIFWLLGSLIWPIIIVGGWLFCGHLARKVTRLANGPDDKAWDYIICNLGGPLVLIALLVGEFNVLAEKFKLKIPQFRNPFVWPEKSDP